MGKVRNPEESEFPSLKAATGGRVNLQQAEKIQQAPERILDYEYVDP
jgi:hypothetical protein